MGNNNAFLATVGALYVIFVLKTRTLFTIYTTTFYVRNKKETNFDSETAYTHNS